MPINPVEAALAGAAIAGITGCIAPLIGQRSAGRLAHGSRLWERRAEVYEYMLTETAWWASMRSEYVRAMDTGKSDRVEVPAAVEDKERREQLRARADLFAEQDVKKALDAVLEADKNSLVAFMRWREKTMEPAETAAGGSELARLRTEAKSAAAVARANQDALVRAAHDASVRMPRQERWRCHRRPSGRKAPKEI
jgi:hypothetical protein